MVERLEDRRLLSAGDLDTSFGSGGHVYADFGTADDYATDVDIQLDGKILVRGGFGLARYNYNGTLDSSFHGAAVLWKGQSLAVGGGRFVIQPDGKILALMSAGLARLTTSGDLDTTFGDRGIAPAGSAYDLALMLGLPSCLIGIMPLRSILRARHRLPTASRAAEAIARRHPEWHAYHSGYFESIS